MLQQKISDDIKTAMKAKDSAKLSTLRLLKTAMKNKEIELIHELSEDEALAVIKSQMKQLKDSVESYEDAGRDEMAESGKAELVILEAYLPAQMSDEDLEAIVKSALEESGATSKADMGKAMGAAMKAVAGQADGNRVKEIVAKLLPVLVFVILGVTLATPAFAATDPTLSTAIILPLLKISRVFLMAFGLVSVMSIMIGGFTYMVASGRCDTQELGMQKISGGTLGVVIIAGLFSVLTVAIESL